MAMVKMESSSQIGNAVRLARKKLALTQPQLALAAGVGVRFIVDLEAGKPTIQLERMLQVLHALGGDIHIGGLKGLNDGE
ncbi:putative HTH-type transcriptional regulator y4mF [Polynucleobacter sp. SHI8]|uniref:helix-turn-helix transcriptional regulator n=1 Tax=unclassified Polynucleobacter TaxID=2640945 RepID=UPI00248FCDA2|nr:MULTISPECIES: helix-turn-helix transcriptional regulator [unclassified Polynucleobacter]BDW10018.1 putative HTH-type transcriptional regulator y4mF [Polynucleobacter sp. SHI2]BDW12464.1 putative HTH-type transcriptional regulator y4mF [Polynucleobacter sp. SHI8]